MKVKLIRTGGFIPVTKVAETEVNLTDKELVSLLDIIQPDKRAYRVKDGNYYELSAGKYCSPVDLGKIPDEYKALFNKLKSEMKIVK